MRLDSGMNLDHCPRQNREWGETLLRREGSKSGST